MKIFNKSFVAVLGGLLLAAGAAWGDVNIFGLDHSPAGNATLTANSTGTLTVGNLGDAGNDGVSIDLSSTIIPGENFMWDGTFDAGTPPVGSFMQWGWVGSIASGAEEQLTSMRETELSSDDYQVTSDFSKISNGTPMTISYYSGGPDGTLVYSEQYAGTSPTLEFAAFNVTKSVDIASRSVGDMDGGHMQVTTAAGIELPSSDDIDYVELNAPTSLNPQYSSVLVTAGGGMDSFTITGEAVTVPEPGGLVTLPLLLAAAIGRRFKRF